MCVCRYLSVMNVMYVDVTTLLEKDFSTHFSAAFLLFSKERRLKIFFLLLK